MDRRTFLQNIGTAAVASSAAHATASELPKSDARPDPPATLWPTFEEITQQLQQWQKKHPQWMQLRQGATSGEGRPVWVARLTDSATADDDKEHVLLTTLHSGIERSGTTTALTILEWLLSSDPAAQDILRRQVIVCLPLVNPDGYVKGTFTNAFGKDPYTGWSVDGPHEPDLQPEAALVHALMKELTPEVHVDVHGLNLAFPGYIMVENSGAAYSNVALRPYHARIMRLMDDAALAEGFPSDLSEQDAERIYWGPALDAIAHTTWSGRPRPYAAIHCYYYYHSLVLTCESCWERSGLLRVRRLFQIGNETWPGEQYAGYPTRIIARNEFHRISAYGQSATQRRRSRVELWNRQRELFHGMNNPQTEGQVLYVCGTSAAAKHWLADETLSGFAARLASHPQMAGREIVRFVDALLARIPAGPGQWGAAPVLYIEGGQAFPEKPAPLQHGIAFRLRLPYARAEPLEIRLNGELLQPSATAGYQLWSALGYTHVQINVPPEETRKNDLFVVTCQYDPREQRSQGWRPRPA